MMAYILGSFLILCMLSAESQSIEQYSEVQRNYFLSTSELRIKNDFADQIKLHISDQDSIFIRAKVLLIDDQNQNRNDDFDVSLKQTGSVSTLSFEIKNLEAHHVFQKSGSDYDPQKDKKEKALLVGTEIDIYLPKDTNVEFESNMGEMHVEHNGGNLLITTNNRINLKLEKSLDANLSLSSLYGELKVSKNLNIKSNDANEGDFQILASNKKANFILNAGGVEISLITLGDIVLDSK
ncbi:MAG: hypothetical protein HRT61_05785 [Ekhidna sp.]|nr:hypothetical protein [Ekhidna sp.]